MQGMRDEQEFRADQYDVPVGEVTARYEGYTGNGADYPDTDVVINVDFTNATWSGSWNGGETDESDVDRYTDSRGIDYISGEVGFNASGTIEGINISADTITANDSDNISGTVDGSFFGDQAQVLGGVSDITKDGERNVEVFATEINGFDGPVN